MAQQQEEESLSIAGAPQAAATVFTARQSAEDLQARLAAVVESSDDAIVSKTLDSIIRTWNAGAQRMFGYTAEEAVGQSVKILIPKDRLSEEDSILERLRRGEQIAHYQTVRLHKNGTALDVSLTVSPIRDAAGKVIGASKIARDITTHKRAQDALAESEARLRGVVEATPECVKIVAPDGALVFMNPAGLAMIQAENLAAVQNSSVLDLVAPEHRAQWRQRHAQVCAGEKLTWEFEIIGLRGCRKWMETHAVPLRLTDGRIGQLAVSSDITHRRNAEAERESLLQRERAARADAERANLIKDEFLATLSHELRTPLNAILGWTQILRSGKHAESDYAEALEVIERNARVQTQLIEDLLDMSRIISGKIRLDIQQVDLQDVIKAAAASVRHSAEAKDIRVQALLDPLAGPVRGDPARLQQCFWNLLSNAIKFTPRGGRIQIGLQRVNSHLEISVADTGQGIKPEFLPHVFERFRQADSTITRRHGGLGLGLSIVKHLAELHGGRVRVQSPGEGHGATFTIELPVMLASPEPSRGRQHPQSTVKSTGPIDHPSLSGITILAVDDDPDARNLIKRLLEECGAQVLLAASAQEGLDLLTANHPNIIVSDVGMPGVDGYEFIKKVRALSPQNGGKTPAVALTAFARAEDRTKALRSGFQTHVVKPVEPMELTAVVASLTSPL